MFWGYCAQCGKGDDGQVDTDSQFYCNKCINEWNIQQYRCVSYAAVYSLLTYEMLSTGDSSNDGCCAERHALWKLNEHFDKIPKLVVVCRLNRKGNKKYFHNSKPCAQCTCTMAFYNVQRVVYSIKKNKFVHENLRNLQKTTYATKGKRILTTEYEIS